MCKRKKGRLVPNSNPQPSGNANFPSYNIDYLDSLVMCLI